mgnify:FL=1
MIADAPNQPRIRSQTVDQSPDFGRFAPSWAVASAILPHRRNYYGLGRPEVPRFLAALYRAKRRPIAITCAGKTDGGGAQVHAVLSVQAFCKAFGIPYVHTPFRLMEHASSLAEVRRWEDSFNLGNGYRRAEDEGLAIVPAADFARTRLRWGERCVVAIEHCHGFTDRYPHALTLVRDEFRRAFNFEPESSARNDAFSIAVHVRRGDVTAQDFPGRYTTTELIFKRVDRLLKLRKSDRPVAVTLYSEGPASQFEPLRQLGCEIACDGDPIDTLRQMARADIIVTAKSSFSYVAGLLTHGLVIYEPFWHPKQPSWVSLDDWQAVETAIKARLPFA